MNPNNPTLPPFSAVRFRSGTSARKPSTNERLNLSECYNGGDEFMLACPRLLIHSL